MGLRIYVGLLLLTPKVLSLPFNSQENAFLSWAPSYAAFHNRHNCWVCRALISWRLPMVGFSASRKGLSSTLWWHLTILRWTGITHCTLTMDIMWLLIISTWFSDYFALYLELYNGICFCLKVFRLQMIVHAPTISVASSNYYLGPLDQRPSVWG